MIRHAISEIVENGTRPTWWQKRLAHRVISPVHGRLRSNGGVYLPNEEWDVLVVLDACRYDLFEEVVDLDDFDSYSRVESRGSSTDEWAWENFSGGAMTDTVYVTANPVMSREAGTPFFRFIEVWRDSFDDSMGTVPADSATDAALMAHRYHQDKRLIVHYLQPHYPFVDHPDLQYADWGQTEEMVPDYVNDGANDVWEALGLGMVDREVVWGAYASNLEYVMESVWELIGEVSGKVVVTSDHGNLIGERVWGVPIYGHVPGVYHPMLRTVPWATINIREGEVVRNNDPVEDRLRRLGYVD